MKVQRNRGTPIALLFL